jgi:Uncharacterized protein conserved in bacteria (DUF2188)
MTSVAAAKIIVKPRDSHGWTMVTHRSRSELFFQTRQRALQFARAYAKLNPPVTLQVYGEKGELESEESFEDVLRGSMDALGGLRLVKP